jgi:hypothetical protein
MLEQTSKRRVKRALIFLMLMSAGDEASLVRLLFLEENLVNLLNPMGKKVNGPPPIPDVGTIRPA